MNACEDKKIHLERFFKGDLNKEDAASLKSHLVKCKGCRRALHREDPLLVFSLLSQQKKEESFWGNYWRPIREKISRDRRWFERLGFIKPLPAAAVLSSLMIVTALFLFVIVNQIPVGLKHMQVSLPEEEVVEETILNSPLLIKEGEGLETANIVTVSVGNTDIVMIYDESMDI